MNRLISKIIVVALVSQCLCLYGQVSQSNLRSMVPGTGATNLGKAEDAASADGDVGIGVLAVRKATPANTSGADGDYEFLQISGGRLWASTNVDTINSVTPLMGNGATGTGSLRTTLSSDNSAIANWGLGAIGAAPPTGMQQAGGVTSGATGGLAGAQTFCDQWVAFNGTASAQLITGVSGRKIYFCSGNLQMNGGANTASLVSGTGTVCATGITAVPGFDGGTTAATGYSFAANSGIVWGGGDSPLARTTNNTDNFCILVGSATRVVGGWNYAIF